ncbi:MAG: hypothetical protein ACYTF6_04095 [Planctomycetota bacterium]
MKVSLIATFAATAVITAWAPGADENQPRVVFVEEAWRPCGPLAIWDMIERRRGQLRSDLNLAAPR